MKVYTKTGDTGTTSLFEGLAYRKIILELKVMGVDNNSYIGLVRDQEMNTHYKDTLAEIQDRLFTIGAILATPQEKR
jgi:cob(I)alamin adenosyltransferase